MEIESAITECAGLAEVAVVGAPDPIKDLVPAAFVTLKAGQAASPEIARAIGAQVAGSISRTAVPERVIFTDVLPKTSGKVMRRLLKGIMVTGDVESGVTALDDRSTIETEGARKASERKTPT